MTSPARIEPSTIIERLAELIVGFGANVQPGQIVALGSELGKEQLTREIAASAYRRGAKYVEVSYADPHIKRARVLNQAPELLGEYPSWFGQRMLALGEQRAARISLAGTTEPHLLDDLDSTLVGKEQSAPRTEAMQVINDRTTNWCAAPCATPGWAQLVFPDLGPDAALAKLWQQLAWICRLDADDPIAAWNERMAELRRASGALGQRRFDALRFTGPGTDLTVGLLPTSAWQFAAFETIDGLAHMPNIPSEEVFTSPDPTRTEGVVRATKPLFTNGSLVEGLEVEFRGGRVVRIDADRNADTLRALVERDEGAARLGEVALVDGAGRVGGTDTTYFDTLLDENAASHLALGAAFAFAVGEEDVANINVSQIHIDFMIGSNDVSVAGVGADGTETPVLVGGRWQV
ncbi:MAG: peptidase aminopeptidase [Thermoleophilia bacterium]|nr:peptidase aminopeptidase [Thermoleophilia bacterium]